MKDKADNKVSRDTKTKQPSVAEAAKPAKPEIKLSAVHAAGATPGDAKLEKPAKPEKPAPHPKLAEVREMMASVEKQFGKNSIMLLGDEQASEPIEVIPSGSIALDRALGVGGYPRGRIIEIFGPESSGKTTLTLHAIAQLQAAGGVAAFIDAEHAFDLRYARGIGVNLDSLLISQPDCGEQALDIVELLTKSGVVDLIVIDSVAALTPRAEIEGDMGDSHMGLQARLMSQALRKLNGAASRSGTTLAFMNQRRQKSGAVFGNPETATGGTAWKFSASVRLGVRRIGKVQSVTPWSATAPGPRS